MLDATTISSHHICVQLSLFMKILLKQDTGVIIVECRTLRYLLHQ